MTSEEFLRAYCEQTGVDRALLEQELLEKAVDHLRAVHNVVAARFQMWLLQQGKRPSAAKSISGSIMAYLKGRSKAKNYIAPRHLALWAAFCVATGHDPMVPVLKIQG